ncbi:MAG: 2-succinyl-5-enolpyruvyl-6-hydroxy-3-cyclohexene-1-carboxylic-acid synthase, partial [Deltaproteobacteria bacterium]|nr:2-succinyl-5-enolpyruvyl-6-hydroxy-3-cyclohexene-1-carboxylic-acid synthase [Deltaproteobacteria bacterium]
MSTASRNVWVGRAVVEELDRLGTPLVCLAPGGRCAPLSMALGEGRSDLPWTTFIDERAAAFHALGVARATGRPAVVITTSGTAVGNLAPAAMEADRAGVPLLFITADRPAEMRNTGANQTVQQADILAPVVRYRADLPCSDPALPLTAILSTLDHAVGMARLQHGPVHLNLQLREPLGPSDAAVPAALASWWTDPSRAPWTRVHHPRRALPQGFADRVEAWRGAERGLVVVGSLPPGAQAPVETFVRSLGWPAHATVDASIGAGVRGLDSVLSDPLLRERLTPDRILWLGGGVVSKKVVLWLRELGDQVPVISITDRTARIDPGFQVRERHIVDYSALAAASGEPNASSDAWTADWRALDRSASAVVAQGAPHWTELAAARAVVGASKALFLGASLPVRLVDWVGAGSVQVSANRGASGIDGVLATAAGWARHVEGPRKVLLGDLTCLHDQGSLPLMREVGMQAVVFNNYGGSIFGMLP